jgi:hypothetical protein
MVEVPTVTPVTTPVEVPMVTLALDADHVPPGGKLDRVELVPSHTVVVPDIDVGGAVTEKKRMREQPDAN